MTRLFHLQVMGPGTLAFTNFRLSRRCDATTIQEGFEQRFEQNQGNFAHEQRRRARHARLSRIVKHFQNAMISAEENVVTDEPHAGLPVGAGIGGEVPPHQIVPETGAFESGSGNAAPTRRQTDLPMTAGEEGEGLSEGEACNKTRRRMRGSSQTLVQAAVKKDGGAKTRRFHRQHQLSSGF